MYQYINGADYPCTLQCYVDHRFYSITSRLSKFRQICKMYWRAADSKISLLLLLLSMLCTTLAACGALCVMIITSSDRARRPIRTELVPDTGAC
jgi:hypothetical protein